MEKHLLSKSTFIRSVQCSKSLYLYKNFPELKDKLSAERKALFSRGTNIGLVARDLYPNGVDASPDTKYDYKQWISRTRELISGGSKIIYEAAFQYERVIAAIDILVNENGVWKAYEVKSSTRISPTYILDASLQYYVIYNSGIALADISIVNINNEYRRTGKIEIAKLFKTTSVLIAAKENQVLVKDKIWESKKVLKEPEIPNVKIGEHCFLPYECDFKGNCWKDVPADSVFELGGVSKADQFSLYNSGVQKITDIAPDYTMKKSAMLQVSCAKSKKVFINKEAIKQFLNSVQYPLHFLDFETFMPGVPLYDGCKPYEHIPFQYSLHLQQKDSSELYHIEYLAQAGSDPHLEFLKKLIADILSGGSILVYGAAFEKSILNSLRKRFPEYEKQIESILHRIIDLMLVFEKHWYYHPSMKGSFSIKNVLPALAPDYSYDNLLIGSGSVAMAAFENLQNETNLFKIMEQREALLEYCKLDTLAMVKILGKLKVSSF